MLEMAKLLPPLIGHVNLVRLSYNMIKLSSVFPVDKTCTHSWKLLRWRMKLLKFNAEDCITLNGLKNLIANRTELGMHRIWTDQYSSIARTFKLQIVMNLEDSKKTFT